MTRVVKIGGRPQSDPRLGALVAAHSGNGHGSMVVVHGGGDEISALQKALGGEPQFVGGRRVTSARDVEMVRMALSGSANKRLVADLVGHGVRAVGVSGEDDALIGAEPAQGGALGHAGTPTLVNVALLRHLLAGGYMPIVSPVSRNLLPEPGNVLNVNGDDAAAAIAVALDADELLLVSDVPGVLVDGAVVARLSATTARTLIADGRAGGGMAAKLEAALRAVDGGVARVRIADLSGLAEPDRGTQLLPDGDAE